MSLKHANRPSDLLFGLSRWVGRRLGETEYPWKRGLEGHAKKRRQVVVPLLRAMVSPFPEAHGLAALNQT